MCDQVYVDGLEGCVDHGYLDRLVHFDWTPGERPALAEAAARLRVVLRATLRSSAYLRQLGLGVSVAAVGFGLCVAGPRKAFIAPSQGHACIAVQADHAGGRVVFARLVPRGGVGPSPRTRVVCPWGSGLQVPILDLRRTVEEWKVCTDSESMMRRPTRKPDLSSVERDAPSSHPASSAMGGEL